MKNYKEYNELTDTQKGLIDVIIGKYVQIKKLKKEIEIIKEDNTFNIGKIKKYITDKKIDGIKNDNFLVYIKDYTSYPSFKNVVENATLDKIINKTISSKLYGIYENGKNTSKKLTVQFS